MRKSRRRLVIPLAVFALVAAAGIAGGLSLVAHAQTEIGTPCTSGTTVPIECSITDPSTDTVDFPSSIQAVVTLESGDDAATADQYAVVTYSVTCYSGGGSSTTDQSTDDTGDAFAFSTDTADAQVTDDLILGYGDPGSCVVNSAEAELEYIPAADDGDLSDLSDDTTGSISMELEWTPQASATSSSSSSSSVDVAYISGWGSKCIDDKANNSSNGAQVIIWGCNHGDSAQSWSWTGYELQHDGKCVNDPAYGGSGTKLILWTCDGGSNEKWSHVSGGVFKLYYSSKGQLCLDDPAFSTTNGTRLMVYTCNNGGNQHWSRS